MGAEARFCHRSLSVCLPQAASYLRFISYSMCLVVEKIVTLWRMHVGWCIRKVNCQHVNGQHCSYHSELEKKVEVSKTKAKQHFVLQLWNSWLDIGRSLRTVLSRSGTTNNLSKNTDWDTSLVLIRSHVVDSCWPAGIKEGKNFCLIFSQFLDSPLMDA